jgi:hypothetical protein
MLHDTDVSERVREQGLAQLECDVPASMSLVEWRDAKRGSDERLSEGG